MEQSLELDIREIVLSNSSFGPKEIRQISSVIGDDYALFSVLRDAVAGLLDR